MKRGSEKFASSRKVRNDEGSRQRQEKKCIRVVSQLLPSELVGHIGRQLLRPALIRCYMPITVLLAIALFAHTRYLSFFFTRAKFLENKIYTEKR